MKHVIAFLLMAFMIGLMVSAFAVINHAQKQVDDLNDIKNAANYIEVFEYSGHEYLRYKTGNGKVGGICHKQDCKFCKETQ